MKDHSLNNSFILYKNIDNIKTKVKMSSYYSNIMLFFLFSILFHCVFINKILQHKTFIISLFIIMLVFLLICSYQTNIDIADEKGAFKTDEIIDKYKF